MMLSHWFAFGFCAALFGCSSSALDHASDAAGGTASASVGGSASGGASGGAPSSGGGGTPDSALKSEWVPYPAGPYGTGRGAVIANLSFLGWKHPDQAQYDTSHFEVVRLSDFYNPDGKTEIKLLAINASAVWCTVCRAEYEDMNTNGTYDAYRAKGVELLGTLFEDNSYFPAEPADLNRWGAVSNHAVKFPLVLDPGFKMGSYFSSDATPLNLLIDVRTMTIVSVTMGYSTNYWSTTVQNAIDKL